MSRIIVMHYSIPLLICYTEFANREKAKKKLGWQARHKVEDVVRFMVKETV